MYLRKRYTKVLEKVYYLRILFPSKDEAAGLIHLESKHSY